MTRGGQETSITNNNPSENVPNAILTLTKNVLGQNVTKTIEPMIKRFSVVETRDDPSLLDEVSTTFSPFSELSTVAVTSLAQQPKKQHSPVVDPKKKKTKSKIKRKDQVQLEKLPVIEQLQPAVSITTEKRKILHDNGQMAVLALPVYSINYVTIHMNLPFKGDLLIAEALFMA